MARSASTALATSCRIPCLSHTSSSSTAPSSAASVRGPRTGPRAAPMALPPHIPWLPPQYLVFVCIMRMRRRRRRVAYASIPRDKMRIGRDDLSRVRHAMCSVLSRALAPRGPRARRVADPCPRLVAPTRQRAFGTMLSSVATAVESARDPPKTNEGDPGWSKLPPPSRHRDSIVALTGTIGAGACVGWSPPSGLTPGRAAQRARCSRWTRTSTSRWTSPSGST